MSPRTLGNCEGHFSLFSAIFRKKKLIDYKKKTTTIYSIMKIDNCSLGLLCYKSSIECLRWQTGLTVNGRVGSLIPDPFCTHVKVTELNRVNHFKQTSNEWA